MKKFTVIIFIISSLFIASIHGSSESSSSEETDGKDDKGGKGMHSMHHHESLYCQTEFVMKEKLIDVPENSVNGYKLLVGDNVDQINCEQILEKSKQKMYLKVRKEHKKDMKSKESIDCLMKKLEEHDYHKMVFKMHSLMGLDMPMEKKDEMKTQMHKETDELVQKTVDECSQTETHKPTESAIGVKVEISTVKAVINEHANVDKHENTLI
ncbi:hypothetical protein PVAND_007835 [Polypedilum vanderplanki]|uniref:Desiccation induced protein 1 n=1 Tax=Polypedilum vanderplanki TaxID=319348 RepID=C7G3L1_POLVA|nr:hypothetical protein PVAND_007835 [Polypedilum vanderplanki]BAH97749.1 desiccation induced protein 1 [Polypedilum vanderplanki]